MQVASYLEFVLEGLARGSNLQHVHESFYHERESIAPALIPILEEDDQRLRLIAACALFRVNESAALPSEQPQVFSRACKIVREILQPSHTLATTACILLVGNGVPHALWPLLRRLRNAEHAELAIAASCALCVSDTCSSRIRRSVMAGHKCQWPTMSALCMQATARCEKHTGTAIDTLGDLLHRSSDQNVQYNVLMSLKYMSPHTAAPWERVLQFALDESRDIEQRAIASWVAGSLAKGNKGITVPLLQFTRTENGALVEGSVNGLRDNGIFTRPVVTRLAELLSSSHADVRWAAAKALTRSGHDALPVLATLVSHIDSHTDRDVLKYIAVTLGALGKYAVPALVKVICDGSVLRVPLAAAVLAETTSDGALAFVTELCHNKNPWLRQVGFGALKNFGATASDAVPLLGQMLSVCDDDDDAAQLLNVLFALGPLALPALPAVLLLVVDSGEELATLASRAVWAMGGAAIPGIDAFIGSAGGEARRRLEGLLTGLRADEAGRFTTYRKLGRDRELQTFVHMADLLIELGEPQSFNALGDLLHERLKNGTPAQRTKRTFQLHVEELRSCFARQWLFDELSGRKQVLSLHGRSVLEEVRAYLIGKKAYTPL
jgi:HEAT repeat protein